MRPIKSPGTMDGVPPPMARLEFALGRLYLALGRVDDARSWLTSAAELRERLDSAQSPWLAEAQIALAEALHVAGRDDEARALLDRAAAIHAAIPDLSVTLRQPMRDAHALLASRR